MVGMELDLPPDRDSLLSPRDHIVRRLAMRGIPQLHLQHFQLGLVAFVRDNKCMISEIVSSILPTILDLIEAQMLPSRELAGVSGKFSIKELFEESILWLQWLMFEGDPQESMNSLAQSCDGQHAVCGAVWGHNDLAYRCRTCEQDPTCAICVPCFQRGNHKDHDYNIIYTGGGCCDCGDETAWKKEGFCSEHKGTEQIRPLPQELAISIGPVLDSLLLYWKDMIMSVEHKHGEDADHGDAYKKTADGLSSAIIQMLINFCNCSESLLSFISSRLMSCSGLPHVLLKAEKLLDTVVVKMLHELLLKLLGDPLFKYNFAKIFIQYYPTIVKQIIKDSSSDSYTERDPMLTTFSVQIYTVPTLTMRLVTEVDLLSVLLGCLKDLFLSCFDAGHLQASKWANIYNTTVRLIEDFRYVMSHQEVPAYVVCERPDISKSWIFLLRLVQGMDAQKRVTGLHTEEENENLIIPFVLGQYLGNVNALFVGGAFYDVKNGCLDKQGPVDIDQQRHAKVGRVSQESSASRTGALEALQFNETHIVGENGKCLPSSVVWLISECLKAIECWLRPEIESSCGIATTNASDLLALRKKSSRGRKGPNIVNRTSMTRMDVDGVEIPFTGDSNWSFGRGSVPEDERVGASRSNDSLHIGETNEFFLDPNYSSRVSDDTLMEVEYCRESTAFSILSMTDWPAINCDVSSQAISFHIPLHRLLSLLLRKALEGCCNVIELPHKANGPTAAIPIHNQDFFRKALSGLHPCGFSAFIMEHPLQLRVFCAQVRAGMWRKNSDAPILSSDWYRSVQRLEQGLESDLFLLQCCAALAPPDSFVQRVLERYGLLNYMSLNLADYNEFEPVLVQEMLTLLIQIVKERRFCGLSMTQNLQRELVYRLAIGDSTHSQLVKSLPRDLSKSDKLQNIVEMLALYRNPSGMKQGKYSLQKAYWKELDLYHPRWSSRELQVAEERFFRFCKVSALNTQLPRWTPIFEPLASVCRIATSKMVLQIVRVVFFYANFSERSSVSRAPDAVLITALHLVSLALDICETYQFSQTDDPLPILASASEEFDVGSSSASVVWKNQSMLSLLVSLMGKHKKQNDDVYSQTSQCSISSLIEALLKKFAQLNSNCMSELKRLAPGVVCNVPQVNSSAQSLTYTSDIDERKLKARQRQAAILEKMKAEQSKFIESLSSNNTEQESYKQKESLPKVDARDESVPVCSLCHDPDSGSRLCLLILLQKSRLASFVDRGPPHWENTGLSHNSHKEVNLSGKLKLIDSSGPHTSSPLQFVEIAGPEDDHDVEPVEVDTFLDFIRDRIPDIGNFQLPKVSHDPAKDSFSFLELMEIYLFDSIMEDMHETQSYSHSGSGESNCSTSAVDSNISQDLGSVLREYVACLSRISSKKQNSSLYDILHLGNLSSKPKGTITSVTRFGPKDCDGIYISSCGHAVHQDCHERYLTSLKQRNIRRLGFEGGHIIDPDLGELLCPVCRRFANSVLPVLPGPADKYGKHVKVSSKIAEVDNISQLPLALSLLQSAEKKVGGGRFLKTCFGKLRETTEPALEPTLRKLYMLYYPHNYNDLSESGRLSQSLVLWDNLRYSLVSTEIAARGRVRASHANSPLKALYGELNSSSGFILPLLLNVAKTTCSSSSIEVLLRFRGIQLFARSICFGISEDCNFTNSDKRRGSLKLEHAESGESFPDIQFWKRAADPILAHDPFSSLMWVLFCLPSFMLSSEFFIPLVHLFYTVSVIQSLITCFSKGFFDASHFTESPLCDLCQVMGKSLPVKKYFVSNCIDPLCPPKDMIRRLTFPYLRRCALLWKLLQSSTTALFDTSNVSEGLNPHSKTDTLEFDNANYLKMELDGIRELEDLFHVSSFEVILKDEVVHSLALKWCKHFSEELKANRFEGVLYYTPAVPFKLMQLPRVYQDLLLRYVKVECSECNSVPEEPALCLLCGKLCSPSWKSCCRASRCLNHAISCGAGLGVFLLVRKTTILLQRSSRQAFWPSPYLDAFGEEDIDVLRGKPLFLNAERYAALTYLVASHGLDRTSEVLRQTTISVFGSD